MHVRFAALVRASNFGGRLTEKIGDEQETLFLGSARSNGELRNSDRSASSLSLQFESDTWRSCIGFNETKKRTKSR